MEENYDMLYEHIVLHSWGETWRRDDPLGLGDADTMGALDNELTGDNGRDAKVGLMAALRKVANENQNNEDIYNRLMELYADTWNAKVFNDICVVLRETRTVFGEIGIVV